MVEEMLTLSDLLLIGHAVLLVLRTALAAAADAIGGADGGAAAAGADVGGNSGGGGGALAACAAAALRREVAEVQTMRTAASRILVERMEAQERTPEAGCGGQGRSQQHPHAVGGGGGEGGEGGGGGGEQEAAAAAAEAAAAAAAAEERVSWRHVNGLYEHGRTVLQYAADAAAAMVDSRARADEVERYDILVSTVLADRQLVEGLQALASMPPHHQLPLLAPSVAAAATAAAAAAADGAATAAEAEAAQHAACSTQCNEVLYRMLVLPWREEAAAAAADGDGGDAAGGAAAAAAAAAGPSLTAEFERSSWALPTLMRGDFRPVGQARVRRLFDESRSLAAECLEALARLAPLGAGEEAAAGAGEVVLGAAGADGAGRKRGPDHPTR
ncbi:hypothetical protein TSOC_011219 [Tetrabaena socialis]|uniref:Uncharacterized protein n=1 Tax=Tetrabaena socialis TaxID=47790 RepID=A0A2J7ZR62_9CHLO|nr:hypothetical protein TSOC_011219 [Tetrabaena socialis]|eukprot:PNH02765.1 hypothetical protein TSOC_011219 [Tetrabaena socialis]